VTIARTLCLLFVVGCATQTSALRDDNRRLAETVTELRTDRRTQDRKVRDLEHRLDELRAKVAADPTASVPALPVEVVAPASAPASAPDGARVVGVADDGTEIVYEGDAASLRPAAQPSLGDTDARIARGGGERTGSISDQPPARRPARTAAAPVLDVPVASDRLEVTRRVPPVSTASARAPVRAKTRDHDAASEHGGDAAAEYRAAVELVKAAKYDDALAALRAFISRYPHHDYADNAQYWLGEAFYAQKDYPRALSEFRRVVEVYPRGNKVPDALLKVGYCYQAMGQGEKARAVLEQVVNTYPKSEPATLAAKRLEAP
jgi:tol-pal system protein YbgF